MEQSESMTIRIPSIWSCKLLNRWINLAQARKIEPCRTSSNQLCCLITWNTGQLEFFVEHDAIEIVQSWEEVHKKYGLNKGEINGSSEEHFG
jgi:hypothetical protein